MHNWIAFKCQENFKNKKIYYLGCKRGFFLHCPNKRICKLKIKPFVCSFCSRNEWLKAVKRFDLMNAKNHLLQNCKVRLSHNLTNSTHSSNLPSAKNMRQMVTQLRWSSRRELTHADTFLGTNQYTHCLANQVYFSTLGFMIKQAACTAGLVADKEYTLGSCLP